jgi:hypothetical protein
MTSKAREIVARVVAAMPIAIAALLACAGAAAAAPGDLERSFADGAGLWTADALARWSDGGGLDDGFGSHGQAQSHLGTVRDEGFAAALVPDGRIVVAGSVGAGDQRDFALTRFEALAASVDPGRVDPQTSPGPTDTPPGTRDATGPAITLRVGRIGLRRLVSERKLPVEVGLDEPGSVALAARVRTPGRRGVRRDVPLAKRTLTLPAAGTRRLTLRPSRAARAALRGARSATLTLTVRATDMAGNASHSATHRAIHRARARSRGGSYFDA